jgi:Adenylate and Guanylate cyclase catalytic domain
MAGQNDQRAVRFYLSACSEIVGVVASKRWNSLFDLHPRRRLLSSPAAFAPVGLCWRGSSAAADIQWQFDTYNRNAAEIPAMRIGIHAGDSVADHNDLFGATVQLASRLCREARANGIVVSGFVREVCDLDTACSVPPEERRLKGFADPLPIFRLEWCKMISPCEA